MLPSSFFIKDAFCWPKTLIKSRLNHDVFFEVVQNFPNQLSRRSPVKDCFRLTTRRQKSMHKAYLILKTMAPI